MANKGLIVKLSSALRLIGGAVCTDAARRLETSRKDADRFSLHLRRADLSKADALFLSHALQSLTAREAFLIKSLSVSHIPEMEDTGALALARAMPRNLWEVGFVGCGLSDDGGQALLEWASKALALQMICVEDNKFSDDLRKRFNALAENDCHPLVVV